MYANSQVRAIERRRDWLLLFRSDSLHFLLLLESSSLCLISDASQTCFDTVRSPRPLERNQRCLCWQPLPLFPSVRFSIPSSLVLRHSSGAVFNSSTRYYNSLSFLRSTKTGTLISFGAVALKYRFVFPSTAVLSSTPLPLVAWLSISIPKLLFPGTSKSPYELDVFCCDSSLS